MPFQKSFFNRLPYWLLAIILLGIVFLWHILTTESYLNILYTLQKGVGVTLWVTLLAFSGAMVLGLLLALARVSRYRILREVAIFYIEIVRGIPMLVLLFYITFVGAPQLIALANWLFSYFIEQGMMSTFSVREFHFTWRAIFALTIGYSAFIAEIFRAGIEAVNQGQIEAAKALGLSRFTILRFVVLPQAIKTILPPLGNDFVAMIKDSALVSVLGVQDITQLGKVYSSSTFLFFETYNVVAFLYLSMTVSLSLIVRGIEYRFKRH